MPLRELRQLLDRHDLSVVGVDMADHHHAGARCSTGARRNFERVTLRIRLKNNSGLDLHE